MGDALGMSLVAVDQALDRLLELGLVAIRPWRTGVRDGVWQLLSVERRGAAARSGKVAHVADLLRSLGFDGRHAD